MGENNESVNVCDDCILTDTPICAILNGIKTLSNIYPTNIKISMTKCSHQTTTNNEGRIEKEITKSGEEYSTSELIRRNIESIQWRKSNKLIKEGKAICYKCRKHLKLVNDKITIFSGFIYCEDCDKKTHDQSFFTSDKEKVVMNIVCGNCNTLISHNFKKSFITIEEIEKAREDLEDLKCPSCKEKISKGL